jgi:hypothetical protein
LESLHVLNHRQLQLAILVDLPESYYNSFHFLRTHNKVALASVGIDTERVKNQAAHHEIKNLTI